MPPRSACLAGGGRLGHRRQDKLNIIANEGRLHEVKHVPLLPTAAVCMPLPRTDPETLCEERVPDLPAETLQRARACQAFVRAKQVETPA